MTKRGFIFLLVFIGLVTFFNTLYNGFLWDDEEQILNNILVHSIYNLPSFFSGSTFNTGGSGMMGGLYYKPFMTSFFSLIYTLFGANAFFFHFFQIILHIINSIFVFLFFKHILSLKKDVIPFILALIFLIHPINVEAVAYISDLQETLFFFFGIITLWLITSVSVLNTKRILLISGLLLSSLLSKESGILFIILVTFYVYIFSRKILKQYLFAAFSSVAIYSFLRFIIAGIFFNTHGLTPISTIPFFERLLSVPKIGIFYLKTFFYPLDLAINQHWVVKSATVTDFFLPLLLNLITAGLLSGTLFYFYSKKNNYFKPFLFFFVWFFAGLGLHLNAIFPLDMTVSERWFYFPIIGLLGMLGIIFLQLKLSALLKKMFLIILIVIIIILTIRTIIRNSNWKDGLTLYGHDVLISTNTFDLENNYGVELFRVGRFNEAERHFKLSTELAPNWWTNWNNLGVIQEKNNDIKNAENSYQKAINNGKYYLAYQNLAKIYLLNESPQKTKDFCLEALKILPNNSSLWSTLSIAEYRLNNMDNALKAAQNAYYLEPNPLSTYVYSQLEQNLPLSDL